MMTHSRFRLGHWVAMFVVAVCASFAPAQEATWPAGEKGPDADGDGICDHYESFIAERFRPIFYTNNRGAIRPGSVRTFVEASALEENGARICGPGTIEAKLEMITHRSSSTMHLEPRATPQFDPEHSDVWVDKAPATVFYRVARFPWNKQSFQIAKGTEYVSLQYFYFCFYNDADFPDNGGDHDGDWCCLDLTLLVSGPGVTPRSPIVHSAIFHNHGRQLWMDNINCHKLAFTNDHLRVYMEGNSNEPWPNAGKNGFGGWPQQPGFRVNSRFQASKGADWPWAPREDRIARPHAGKGATIQDYALISLGERGHPGDDPLARFVMTYAGFYGTRAPRPPKAPPNDPPRGPAFQDSMWERAFKDGSAFRKWVEWLGEDSFREHTEPPLHEP